MPLVEGATIPAYRAREADDGLYIFFTNPESENIKFPVGYGQSFTEDIKEMTVRVNYANNKYYLDLCFEPYSSLLYKLHNGKSEQIDISFIPSSPIKREFPDDFSAPWLVK